MKNYNQAYMKNSFEAAKLYCKAFGAEIGKSEFYHWKKGHKIDYGTIDY